MSARIELPSSIVDMMLARYAEGASVRDVSREFSLNTIVVLRVFRENGVRRRGVREQARLSHAAVHGDLIDRVMARCTWVEDTGCLVWRGAMRGNQPVMRYEGQNVRLRRAMLAWHGKPVQPRHPAWTTCRRARCLNAAHLASGDVPTFRRHLVESGRTSKGAVHALRVATGLRGRMKLDWERVEEIRRRAAEGTGTYRGMAQEYGVSPATISQILRYRTWRPRELLLLPGAAA